VKVFLSLDNPVKKWFNHEDGMLNAVSYKGGVKIMPKEGIYDVHCHIIPGVDDGASDYEETKRLLQMEYNQGVRGIIATPHFRFQMFETPIEHIKEQFVLAQRAAAEISNDLEVYLGCEFHVNMEMTEMLKAGKVSTMAGSRYVLTEFSENSEVSYIRERIYALLSNGYKPVIAHIERYEATRLDLNFVEELDDMGACMQINADSIIGKEGFFIKRFCIKLMKYDLVQFVGSDCHNMYDRISRVGEAYSYVKKKMGETYANNLFIENPQKILKDAKRRKER